LFLRHADARGAPEHEIVARIWPCADSLRAAPKR